MNDMHTERSPPLRPYTIGKGSPPNRGNWRRRKYSITAALRDLLAGEYLAERMIEPEIDQPPHRGMSRQQHSLANAAQYLRITDPDRQYSVRKAAGEWRVYRVK